MDRSNDRKKFLSFKNVAENALEAEFCSHQTCEDIFRRMQEEDIKKWVENFYEAKEKDLVNDYKNLFLLVARKFSALGVKDQALKAISEAESYCYSESVSEMAEIEELKKQIQGSEMQVPSQPPVEAPVQPEPAPEPQPPVAEPVPPEPASKPQPPVQPKPAPKPQPPVEAPVPPEPTPKPQPPVETPVQPQPTPKPPQQAPAQPGKKNKNLLIIGGVAAAVVVLLAGVFAFGGSDKKTTPDKPDKKIEAQKVEKFNVSFDVPEGTKVKIDGNLVDAAGGVQLGKGKHSVNMEHPLFDLVYDKEINVSEATKFSLVKDTKVGEKANALVKKADTDMMNDILRQACNSNQMSFDSALYSSDADTNGKLTKAYEAMHNFASKKGIKNMSIEQTDLGKLELVNDGRQFLLKGTAELVGTGEAGQKFSYSVYTVLEVKGDKLLVKSLESFKAKLLK